MAYVNIPSLTDWQYDEDTKKLKHNTGTARSSVNTLYSAIMDLADDSGFMDSSVPMSAQTPTEYTLINGWTFSADSDLDFLYGGSIVVQKATTDRDVWANFYTLGTIAAGSVMYIQQNGALVATYSGYASGHLDQLVKVVANGGDVDSRNVTIFCRNLGNLYDNFTSQASATGGRNPVPIATADDTDDDASGASVAGVTIAFGAVSKDIGDGGGAQPYSAVIDGGGNSALAVYRYLKYIARRENTTAVDSPENTTAGRFYRYANAAYAEKKSAPFGTFAGGIFFGAQGIWLENISDPNNRELLDDNAVPRTPPVSITFAVTSVASGDRVLVARSTGPGSVLVKKDQFTLDGAHTAGGSTVVVSEVVGTDIPDTGVIRINDDRYPYTSVNRGTKAFTLSGTLSASYSTGTNTYVPLIDDVASSTSIVSPSMIYSADFDVVYRVRKKGIIPFENSAVVGSAGQSVSAIRTVDPIVT